MASNSSRAELEIRDVRGMFRQAAISFKASFPLFLTIALLSTVFEAAVFSGLVSVSRQTSNSSLSQSTHSELHTGGPKKPDTGKIMLSHILASLLPPDDHTFRPEDVQHEDLPTSTLPSNDAEDPIKPNYGASPMIDVAVARENSVSVKEVQKKLPFPTENTNALKSLSTVVVQEDEATSKKGTGRQENGGLLDQHSISGGILNFEAIDNLVAPASLEEANHENENGGNPMRQHDQGGISHVSVGSAIVHLEGNDLIVSEKGADEESLFEHMFELSEDTDTSSGLFQLKFEVVSNETKELSQESVIDAFGLTLFTGKIFRRKGLDHGAGPSGGITILIICLLILTVLAIIFVVVDLQHAMVLGSVAYSVVSTHMGKRASVRRAIWSGLKSGVGRLMWLSFLHVFFCSVQTQIFTKILFGGIMEAEQAEQLSHRLSTPPFSLLAPFKDMAASSPGMAFRIGLFIGLHNSFDAVAYCIYVVTCWVVTIEGNRRVLGAVTRSWGLITGMIKQAIVIWLLEATLCGQTSHWLLQQAIGKFATDFVLSAAQSYFLVLWLIFYLSARSVHDQQSHFSHRTLEDFLDRFK